MSIGLVGRDGRRAKLSCASSSSCISAPADVSGNSWLSGDDARIDSLGACLSSGECSSVLGTSLSPSDMFSIDRALCKEEDARAGPFDKCLTGGAVLLSSVPWVYLASCCSCSKALDEEDDLENCPNETFLSCGDLSPFSTSSLNLNVRAAFPFFLGEGELDSLV